MQPPQQQPSLLPAIWAEPRVSTRAADSLAAGAGGGGSAASLSSAELQRPNDLRRVRIGKRRSSNALDGVSPTSSASCKVGVVVENDGKQVLPPQVVVCCIGERGNASAYSAFCLGWCCRYTTTQVN